jgi:hypothetical protein
VIFKPVENLALFSEGSDSFLPYQSNANKPAGKLAYMFINLDKLMLAYWGNCGAALPILADLLCVPKIVTHPVMTSKNIADLASISKITIHAGQCESLIGDITYGDLLRAFETTKAKAGVLTLQGDFEKSYVIDLVSYLSYAKEGNGKVKPVSRIVVTGKNLDDETKTIDVYSPKSIVKIDFCSTEPVVTLQAQLVKLARWVFAEMEADTSIAPPQYTKTWMDHAEAVEDD